MTDTPMSPNAPSPQLNRRSADRLNVYPANYVRTWIDSLVEIRGKVVHRGTAPGPLDTAGVREWIPRMRRIGQALDQRILNWANTELAPLPK